MDIQEIAKKFAEIREAKGVEVSRNFAYSNGCWVNKNGELIPFTNIPNDYFLNIVKIVIKWCISRAEKEYTTRLASAIHAESFLIGEMALMSIGNDYDDYDEDVDDLERLKRWRSWQDCYVNGFSIRHTFAREIERRGLWNTPPCDQLKGL